MNPLNMKTIEQCKDEAAREFNYLNFAQCLPAYGPQFFKDVCERAMEIYAASQVESKMEEVREKLPLEITPDELQQDYEDRLKDYGSDFASGFSNGGQYYFQLLLEEVKELLK